jgi:hypothetical protein
MRKKKEKYCYSLICKTPTANEKNSMDVLGFEDKST